MDRTERDQLASLDFLTAEDRNRARKASRLAGIAHLARTPVDRLDQPHVRAAIVRNTPSKGALRRSSTRPVWPVYSHVSEKTWEMVGIILGTLYEASDDPALRP